MTAVGGLMMFYGHLTTAFLVYDRINEIRCTAGLRDFISLEISQQTPGNSLVARMSRFIRDAFAGRVQSQSVRRELGIRPADLT